MAGRDAAGGVSRFRLLLLSGAAVGLAVLLCVAVAEAVLRLARGEGRYFPYHPSTVTVMYPSEEATPGVRDPSYFTINSLGARGPELEGQPLRILTIGGSTTACTALDDDESWPALLASELDARAGYDAAWVINSGVDGHNSHHHLMHVEYFLPQLPDMTHVLVYAGLNDVGMWLYVSDWDPHYLDDPAHWDERVGEAFRLSAYAPPGLPWYKGLELWRRASLLKSRFLSRRLARERDAGRIEQDDAFQWQAREQERRAAAEKKFVHRAKMETLPAALDSYARNLVRIVAGVRREGAEPILVAQALDHVLLDEEERHRWWMGAMDGGETYVKEEQMRELVQAYNRRMHEVAQREGALFVDLPALLRAERGLFYDGLHFNEHGARVTARTLAEHLWNAGIANAAGIAERVAPNPSTP